MVKFNLFELSKKKKSTDHQKVYWEHSVEDLHIVTNTNLLPLKSSSVGRFGRSDCISSNKVKAFSIRASTLLDSISL